MLAGALPAAAAEPAADWPALRARRWRWADLLRRVYQVEVCPACGGAMRILAFITELAVVRRILAHLERGGIDARASAGGGRGGSTRAAAWAA